MKPRNTSIFVLSLGAAAGLAAFPGPLSALAADSPESGAPGEPQNVFFGGGNDQDGPPFGPPPGFFRGGPGGPGGPGMREDIKLVKQFDKDSNGWLNFEERKAARKHLETLRSNQGGQRGPFGPGGPRRPGGGGFGPNEQTPKPGMKVSPEEIKASPDAPLYASNVLRTLFLYFDAPDWEKELEAFAKTDVDVPARLTVDGKSYPEVGVRFRGNTSYMMVGTGSKRPLNISLDMAHEDQNVMGFRTLNLLNSHEDPSFLRTVLALQMARDYFPAPRANFVRLVINGENWGVYANVEQFNKDFTKHWFDSTKGARWKVPGSPGGRGGLEYLGDDVARYKGIYEIKSKDEPKSWAALMNLTKVLSETPQDELEGKLAPLLDIDGALKFLAWDNVLASGDGFWTRASDYSLYQDPQGRFHLIPYDVNETFSMGGGPGGFGGRGAGFGPGTFMAPRLLELGDSDKNDKLSADEMTALSETLFDKMDDQKTGKLTREELAERLNAFFGPPDGGPGGPRRQGPGGPPDGREGFQGGRRGFGPGMFVGPMILSAADMNTDENLTRDELKSLFTKWFNEWNTAKTDGLDAQAISKGLSASLARAETNAPSGGPGGPRGAGRGPGRGGFGGGGPTLDPLAGMTDSNKPVLSKLLAVPAFKARYLGYVKHMAQNWLDWNKLGPIARQQHVLIADELRRDTKKLQSFEQFQAALEGDNQSAARGSIKAFVEQRRAFLLNHPEVKAANPIGPK